MMGAGPERPPLLAQERIWKMMRTRETTRR